MQTVKVYGATWCHDTVNTLAHLKQAKVPSEFFDIDQDSDALDWVLQHNHGKRKLPTVDVGGTILSIPSNEELDEALNAK